MSKVKRDIVMELHKPARKNFKRRHVVLNGIDDLWQSDIGDFIKYSRENRGNKYILFVIDCFSKYLWTHPLKTKNAVDVENVMHEILREGRVPKNMQTDAGKEFYNKSFKGLMKKYGINHYSSYSTKKASIVERVIRTIKNTLYKTFTLQGTYKWIDILSEITNNYNNTKHRTIKMKPSKVTASNEKHLLATVFSNIKVKGKSKFKVGDAVRISKYKGTFDKGYTHNWSCEIFKIYKVKVTDPVTYLLEDMKGLPILGGFYEQELQRVKYEDIYLVERVLRRRGNKVFVKWLGLPISENSWISKKNAL